MALKISFEKELSIIEMYTTSNMNAAEIGRSEGVTDVTVLNILKRNGIHTKPLSSLIRVANKKVGSERDLEICKRLETGESRVSIAKDFGVTAHAITWVAKKNNGKVEPKRKYSLNEEAFEEFTPEACYWIGWVASDGSISTHRSGAEYVVLSTKDDWPVEEFRKFLGSNQKIRNIKNGGFGGSSTINVFAVCSKKLSSDLQKQGISKRKTWDLRVSKELASSPDFWRGMIDGDGCIFYTENSGNCSISLCCGSRIFLGQFAEFLKKNIDFEPNVVKSNSILRVCISGKKCTRLIEVLGYLDETKPTLPRKREKALKIYESLSPGV